jgi:hypothetical protein
VSEREREKERERERERERETEREREREERLHTFVRDDTIDRLKSSVGC